MSGAPRWTRTRDGATLYQATEEHVALVLRALGIDEATFARALDGYAGRCDAANPSRDARLSAFEQSWAEVSPHRAALPEASAPFACLACGEPRVLPAIARRASGSSASLVYGRCGGCGHATLTAGAAPPSIYGAGYYDGRDDGGAGYDAYARERAYREAKGRRLLAWILAHAARPPRSLLEIGSGFGFARRAAEERGLAASGVDVNPAAAAAARAIYGQATFTGTLAEALAAGAVSRGGADVVLYQFVLEHLPDPRAELRRAAEALAPCGLLALVVPSAEATELSVFGGSYRSLRSDHLHLYSRRSLALLCEEAGLARVVTQSECNLHLLRGFLAEEELTELYESGLGPDLLHLARKEHP